MKAIQITRYGGRDVLEINEIPKPTEGPGEILIRIFAAGINPVDYKIREGRLAMRMPNRFPITLGWDCAGIVESCGEGVSRFKVGDKVFAYCRAAEIHRGTYSQYIAISENNAAVMPDSLSFEEAASYPLASLTAYQSLFEAAHLRSGQRVFVHAVAGGVGGFAAQMAVAGGASVIGTAQTVNHDYARSLGLTKVIDYSREDFEAVTLGQYPDGVDICFDCVGGPVTEKSMAIVKKNGVLVSILQPADDATLARAAKKGINYKYVFVRPEWTHLEKIGSMIVSGILKTTLAAVLPLEQAARAHELIESGHTRGKIVLKIGS